MSIPRRFPRIPNLVSAFVLRYNDKGVILWNGNVRDSYETKQGVLSCSGNAATADVRSNPVWISRNVTARNVGQKYRHEVNNEL